MLSPTLLSQEGNAGSSAGSSRRPPTHRPRKTLPWRTGFSWPDLDLRSHLGPQQRGAGRISLWRLIICHRKHFANNGAVSKPTHLQDAEQRRLRWLSRSLPVQLLSPLPSKHIMVSGGVFPTRSEKPKLGRLCCFRSPFSRGSSTGRTKEVMQTENAACWKLLCGKGETQDTAAPSPGQQHKGWPCQLRFLIITYLKIPISHQYFHNYSNTFQLNFSVT